MLAYLIGAHLIGDFVLQDHSMQTKSEKSWVCTIHLLHYALPFIFMLFMGVKIPAWMFLAIMIEHWLQDRFRLHLLWMKWYGQTPPSIWREGPLFVDQAMHIGFMWLLCLINQPV